MCTSSAVITLDKQKIQKQENLKVVRKLNQINNDLINYTQKDSQDTTIDSHCDKEKFNEMYQNLSQIKDQEHESDNELCELMLNQFQIGNFNDEFQNQDDVLQNTINLSELFIQNMREKITKDCKSKQILSNPQGNMYAYSQDKNFGGQLRYFAKYEKVRIGDWICTICGNNNFKRTANCKICFNVKYKIRLVINNVNDSSYSYNWNNENNK